MRLRLTVIEDSVNVRRYVTLLGIWLAMALLGISSLVYNEYVVEKRVILRSQQLILSTLATEIAIDSNTLSPESTAMLTDLLSTQYSALLFSHDVSLLLETMRALILGANQIRVIGAQNCTLFELYLAQIYGHDEGVSSSLALRALTDQFDMSLARWHHTDYRIARLWDTAKLKVLLFSLCFSLVCFCSRLVSPKTNFRKASTVAFVASWLLLFLPHMS
ncbi:hypothetical protein RJY99_003617 [Vibrio vulnificus]|nr:hypothetical protein [Vibrio vulnificus]